VAIPLDNLGNLYRAKGDDERAEALFKRVLAIKARSLKPDDPEIATTLSNLAVLYSDQRNYEKAEPLLQRARRSRRRRWTNASGSRHAP